MEIKYKKLNENAKKPVKGSKLAGGYDVTVTEIIHKSDNLVHCKLGLSFEIPENTKLMIIPRSSLTKYSWVLANSIGLIDADFRGEVQARFRALPTGILPNIISTPLSSTPVQVGYKLAYEEFPYKEGDRIGQIFLSKVIGTEFVEAEVLSETKRQEGGYGSTGNS